MSINQIIIIAIVIILSVLGIRMLFMIRPYYESINKYLVILALLLGIIIGLFLIYVLLYLGKFL